MAAPAPSSEQPLPPDADPVAIRACLPAAVAAVFDREWEHVLEQAKRSKDLAGVRDLLQNWRHHAYQELREPGACVRLQAAAARAEATRRAPEGSVSEPDIRALIGDRLATVEAAPAVRPARGRSGAPPRARREREVHLLRVVWLELPGS